MAVDQHDLHSNKNGPMGNVGEYAGLGLQLVGSIVLFLLLGRWLDGRLGTTPWLLVLGVFVGVGLGFTIMLRKVSGSGQGGRPPSGTRL